jgi:hypothetical protein
MRHTFGALAAATVTSAALILPAGIAQASTAPPCHASVSNGSPVDYTSVIVYVNTSAGPSTRITTAAHYKTVTTTHTFGDPKAPKGQRQADARTSYYISGAKPGYKVAVDVTVRIGSRSGSCSTSFVPKR